MQRKQRSDHYQRRDSAGDEGRKDMRRQLRNRHHAVGNHMPEATGILRGEPAQRQARDMITDTLPGALQDRHTHRYAGLVYLASPGPTHHHARQRQAQP